MYYLLRTYEIPNSITPNEERKKTNSKKTIFFSQNDSRLWIDAVFHLNGHFSAYTKGNNIRRTLLEFLKKHETDYTYIRRYHSRFIPEGVAEV
jgi:hypothetical protein